VTVRFLEVAQRELDEAIAYYNSQVPGLGDASVLDRLMKVLERPYDEQPENDALAERRPEWARHKAGCSALSCSS